MPAQIFNRKKRASEGKGRERRGRQGERDNLERLRGHYCGAARERPKPKLLLSAETEYSAETQLFCKEQNSRIPNCTYPIVQICHYSVSAEYSVRYSGEYFGRNRFRSDSRRRGGGGGGEKEIFRATAAAATEIHTRRKEGRP